MRALPLNLISGGLPPTAYIGTLHYPYEFIEYVYRISQGYIMYLCPAIYFNIDSANAEGLGETLVSRLGKLGITRREIMF